MKHPVALSLLLLFGAASLAQARLGETQDQIVARFGNGSPFFIIYGGPHDGLKQQQFRKPGFDIQVLFTDFSVGETYTASSKLTEDQIQNLLAANSEGHPWKESAGAGASRFWTRDDGATARLTDTQFEFKSKFLIEKEDRWKQAQLPDVNGF
jgi:hypothetical protein